MNRIALLIIVFAASTVISEAQYVTFKYDRNGNRTERKLSASSVKTNDQKLNYVKATEDAMERALIEKEISAWPNKTTGPVTVEIKNYNPADDGSIEVYDMAGRLLFSQKTGTKTQLDISSAPHGIYLLVVTINGLPTSFRIVRE